MLPLKHHQNHKSELLCEKRKDLDLPKIVLDDSFTAIVTMTIASTATTQLRVKVSHR